MPCAGGETETGALAHCLGREEGAVSGDDDDRRPHGSFAASSLPAELHIEKERGVIRGRLGKNTAGQYAVTVMYTQNGVTFSQSFTWTVLKGASPNQQSAKKESDKERN